MYGCRVAGIIDVMGVQLWLDIVGLYGCRHGLDIIDVWVSYGWIFP